ncbi:MAG TPA: AraC family transcriptional regulator [Alphaproteobacteria bacterium]|jgi:AraC-like DNA-binding protein|nr:AraC family transcriptional regulator [Alphaproteobacteria bacterium]
MSDRETTAPPRFKIRTGNVDEFRSVVGNLLRPFALCARAGRYDARLEHWQHGTVGITTIAYGNEVEIDVDPLERFYLLVVAADGAYRARSLGAELDFAGDSAQVINPVAPLAMRWNARCRQLVLRFDKAQVSDAVAALTGGRARAAPVFGESLSLATPAGRRLRRTIELLLADAVSDDGAGMRLGLRQIDQRLLAELFAAAEHDLPCAAERWRGAPYYVKRAEAFIAGNLENDIGLVDIVASSGVNMRTLHHGFRRCRGMGPMAWLRRLRLDRAHADLEAADPGSATVTEIAARWGFLHQGKFAQQYRARFGATPSETLRGVR